MSNTAENQISILTEAKLQFNPKLKVITVKKTTGKYVDEVWLKFLMTAEVIEAYKLIRRADETEIELTFAVE